MGRCNKPTVNPKSYRGMEQWWFARLITWNTRVQFSLPHPKNNSSILVAGKLHLLAPGPDLSKRLSPQLERLRTVTCGGSIMQSNSIPHQNKSTISSCYCKCGDDWAYGCICWCHGKQMTERRGLIWSDAELKSEAWRSGRMQEQAEGYYANNN